MKIDIVTIGNSRGIRIPKALLEQCRFGDSADLSVEDDRLVLSPVHAPRAGWAGKFKEMAAQGDDALLDAETSSDFDENEWEW